MSELVNEAVKRELKTWTKRVGKTLKELLREFTDDIVPMVKTAQPDMSDADVRKRALKVHQNRYRRIYGAIKRSKAELFRGFLEGTHIEDRVQTLMRVAESYKKDEERTRVGIEMGRLNEDGIPIDPRVTVRGRANTNFGQPLAKAQPQFIRSVYGFAVDENNRWKEFRMTAWEELAENLTCPLYMPLEFRATVKQETSPFLLNATQLTKFMRLDSEDWDMEGIIRENGSFKTLSEMPGILSVKGNRVYRFEVTVLNMNLETRGENRLAYVVDDSLADWDQQVTCFIPPSVNINFGDDSDIYLIARVGKGRQGPSLSALGVLPLKGRSTFKDTVRFKQEDLLAELV